MGQLFDDCKTRHIAAASRFSPHNTTKHSELHNSASCDVVLITQGPPAPQPPTTAACFWPRRLIWCERSLKITLMLSGHFTSSSTAEGRVAFLSPPPQVCDDPLVHFNRNSLYHGSLSMFDANSYRWRERRAMARNHAPDYSHAKLDNAFVRVNGNQWWQEVAAESGHASRLCHRSRAAFSSTFYLYSEASDEKRHAKSTQSHTIGPLRPW